MEQKLEERVTTEMVRHVAGLAKIEVQDSELGRMQQEMEEMLGFMNQVAGASQELDIQQTKIPPQQMMTLRDDVVTNGDQRDEMLRNAPQAAPAGIVVPRSI